MSGIQERTFVFEHAHTQQSTILEVKDDFGLQYFNLKVVLDPYCPGLRCDQIQIYNPETVDFISLSKVTSSLQLVPNFLFEPNFVLFKITKNKFQRNHSIVIPEINVELEQVSNDLAEKKSGQRTIGQVLEIVKKWRNLHLHGRTSQRKRLNLQDAARVIGVPRKSLDDYYCQLRLGQQLQFDFFSNISKKMRILRNFVREQKPRKQLLTEKKNQRHPKDLKVLEQFQCYLQKQPVVEQSVQKAEPSNHQEIQDLGLKIQLKTETSQYENIIYEPEEENPVTPYFEQRHKNIPKLRNDFFKDFQAPKNVCLDPYYELKGKDELRNNDFLFFD